MKNIYKLLKRSKSFLKTIPSKLSTKLKTQKNILIDSINLPKKLIEKAQDQIEKKVANEEENVILKPSSFFFKSITWTLIGGSCFGFIWLGLAKTDEIIVVQGKLEPIKKVVDVQIPSGNVVHEVLIKEGQIVEKDQILILLDKESVLNKVETTQKILDYNKDTLDKLKFLADQGAVSQMQYLQQASQVAQLESQYVQEKIILNYQEIRAPIAGTIFDIKPTGKGYVAATSEPILKIVPNDKLKAKVEIDSSKIGFVGLGKKADISIDSFPASDYGVVEGTIQRIGSDALSPDPMQGKGFRFPADISLNSQTLKLKNGKSLPLQVGMSLTANIKLRKVSYLQLLLGTFKNKADSLRSL